MYGIVILAAATFGLSTAPALQVLDGDTINVIGRKPAEVRQEAENFVRKVGVASRPIARFADPVCPKALNVPAAIADKVEERIRELAREAGALVARPPCRGNLNVTFASQTDGVIERVLGRSPGMFEETGPGYAAKIKASRAPIRWWHTTAQRSKDGLRTLGNELPPAVSARSEQPGAVPMGGQVYQQYQSSVISSQMVRALTSATIIVDVDRANGLPLDSVAAFAAMVGLAEIRFDEETPPNSILGLMVDVRARDLTPLDRTFLRTLYKLPLDRTAVAHRGLLIRGLVGGAEPDKLER